MSIPPSRTTASRGELDWLEDGEPDHDDGADPDHARGRGHQRCSPTGNQGVTLDGVVVAASAPVDAILGSYTIAAFDDCGGHYNPNDGYHMHGAVGCSEVGEAVDGDPPIFGYALDGYALHSPFEAGE